MAKYSELLKNRNFVFYCFGQFVSQFGDRLVQIILIGLVYKRSPGSTTQLAKLFFFTVLPSFLISPIAGVWVDRWNKKYTMIISDIIRGFMILLVPVLFIGLPSFVPTYLIIFIVFASACFFFPARQSIIPDLVSRDNLLIANSFATIGWVVAGVAGFALGGFIVEWIGLKNGLFVNSLVYFSSALLLSFVIYSGKRRFEKEGLKKLGKDITEAIRRSFFYELKEGLKYLFGFKDLRLVIYAFFLLMSAIGAVYVVGVVFIQETLHTATKDIAIFGVFLYLGLLLGSFVYGKTGERFSRQSAIFISFISGGVFLALFTVFLKLTGSSRVGSVFAFFLGLSVSPIIVSANTLIHESIDESLRGRVFASIGIVMNAGFLIFMLAASLLAERIDKFWILIACALMFFMWGVVGYWMRTSRRTFSSS